MENQSPKVSKKMLWAGRILTGLTSLFMLMDGIAKLARPAPVVETFVTLGIPESQTTTLGIIALVCTAIYMIPKTFVLGAILLTGYLGGATAIHLRAEAPNLFAVFMGVLVWGGLYLRDERLRALFPILSKPVV